MQKYVDKAVIVDTTGDLLGTSAAKKIVKKLSEDSSLAEKTLKYLDNSISRVACNMVTWLKNQLLSSRKGMKATVVLFFFLGMSSLLFCINPKDEGIYEDAYMVTNAILKVT